MNFRRLAVIVTASVVLSACAKTYVVQPIALAGQDVRFGQGTPTTFSDKAEGSVQVTPLGVSEQDGRLVFGVAAFNKARAPSNFGVENITLTSGDGTPVTVYTSGELVAEAKRKAAWAAFAVALSGAAAAYSANQNAYRTTTGTVVTPRGVSTFTAQTYDPTAAAIGTAAATAATGAGLVAIKNSLDRTISDLRGEILQTTTVDPEQSYGGTVVSDQPRRARLPYEVILAVFWNREEHLFRYWVTTEGGPQPQPSLAQSTGSQPPIARTGAFPPSAPPPNNPRPAALTSGGAFPPVTSSGTR